ncbi:MAG TPA: type II toxin-antitoxin system RelE/ParE family toxin [Bryobacteraceae bacterium]|jgi:plasmid stabilization system protein ParE|nr:type II toxin-antitoxin system RelE/ParE family toxin [Bryobacteraceae bacterium]
MSDYDLHPEAFIDIDEIALYLGEDSPEAAHRIVDEIYRAIQSLVPLPHRGHRRSDLTSRPHRCPAWSPQPPRHGRDPERPRVGHFLYLGKGDAPIQGEGGQHFCDGDIRDTVAPLCDLDSEFRKTWTPYSRRWSYKARQ